MVDVRLLCFFLVVGVGWCAEQCHWNGRYVNGRCHCFQGFTGSDCATDCHCEGHGTCEPDGSCQCEAGWQWAASQHKCVWSCQHCATGTHCIGPGECGCSKNCRWGQCRNGVCQCYHGYRGEDCSIFDATIMSNQGVTVGVNLNGLSYYSPENKWVDVAKQSQDWITQRTSRHDWNTGEHDSVHWRKDGYPARLDGDLVVGKLMYRGFGSHEEPGNYTVLYDGQGTVNFALAANTVHYDGQGRLVAEFPNFRDGGVLLKVTSTNPANPIRNIRFLPPGYENSHQRFPFHPVFLEFLQRFSEIRFMDYLSTNGHEPEPTTWASRRSPEFHTQTGPEGGSIEHLVELVNVAGVNPWVNVPHAADDNYVTQLAAYLKQHLRPDLKVYVEYSNEVWNGIFRQARYAQEKGGALFPESAKFKQGMRYYNKRATEVADLFIKAWGSPRSRVVTVYAWQTGFRDFYRQALEDLGSRKASFDALAITGYFGCDKATTRHADQFASMSMSQIQHLCDVDLLNQTSAFKYYMGVAKDHGLKLVMYEGGPTVMEGSAIQGHGNHEAITNHAIAFHRDDHIQRPVQDVMNAWYSQVTRDPANAAPGGLFNYFSSCSTPSKYGSWGMTEWTGQNLASVPKWRAVQNFIHTHWAANPRGPKCSLVKDRVTGTIFGCYRSGAGQKFLCSKSADNGRTWTNLAGGLQYTNDDYVTLDGYDVNSKKLYVRVTDQLDVNTYHVYNDHSSHWSTLQNFAYYTEEFSPSVIPRFPEGANHGLDAHIHC